MYGVPRSTSTSTITVRAASWGCCDGGDGEPSNAATVVAAGRQRDRNNPALPTYGVEDDVEEEMVRKSQGALVALE